MSGSPFDSVREMAFNTVLNRMGVAASWTPSGGGATQTAEVLFREPTEDDNLADVNYTPGTWMCEYKEPAFTGLFASVDAGGSETIIVDGKEYYVRHIARIFDGWNFKARLEKK